MLISQLLADTSWAMPRAAFDRLAERARTDALVGAGDVAALSRSRPPSRTDAAIGVLPLMGVLTHRETLFSGLFGGTALQTFTAEYRQMVATPGVSTIVIDVDSPGGMVAGTPELAAVLRQPRRQHLIAVVNDLAMSAAYWIISGADEIVVTPSGRLGSIGVVAQHTDLSKAGALRGVKTTIISAGTRKADGNEFEPLSDRARADLQAHVDYAYDMFVHDVARGRVASEARVRDGWQARVFTAATAVKLGLADRVATFDETLARVARRPVPRRTTARADAKARRMRAAHRARAGCA